MKSIERVQGDERDVVILSTGYHKAENGTLPYRFGPLNQTGGERRLNVAISRSRAEVHVVSSFSHHDMDRGGRALAAWNCGGSTWNSRPAAAVSCREWSAMNLSTVSSSMS